MLANILAERAGASDPKRTQFPICRSRIAFFQGKHAGQKEIRLLSTTDQQIIEGLEPWAGGHPYLFDLHTLDNMRKHRRLIAADVLAIDPAVSKTANHRGIRVSGVWKGFKDGAVVGWAKIDAPKPDIQIAPKVTLPIGQALPAPALLGALHDFARATESVIDLFD